MSIGAPGSRSLLGAVAGGGADLPDAADRGDLRRLSPASCSRASASAGALDALWLSLRTTAAALAIIVVVGTPAAYMLATRSFRGKALLVTLVELPLVLPPAVAGIAPARRGRARRAARRARSRRPGSSWPWRPRASWWRSRSSRRRSTCARRWPRSLGRPHAARGVAHARRVRGARVRARDDPGGDAGARGRRRAGARARARGVRGDVDVRGLVRGHHADRRRSRSTTASARSSNPPSPCRRSWWRCPVRSSCR